MGNSNLRNSGLWSEAKQSPKIAPSVLPSPPPHPHLISECAPMFYKHVLYIFYLGERDGLGNASEQKVGQSENCGDRE